MEKTNKVEANTTEPVDQQAHPRVVFVTDEPLPEALRALFPDATTTGCDKHKPVLDEKERAKEESVENTVRRVAYGKLQVVAGEYGLRFNEQELIALYHLSAAANPKVAINAAHDMCRQFIGSWGI